MSETATLPSPAAVTAPRAAARTNRLGRWVDFALVGLALAFAFLSASFVARNSDLWLHLATGRLIVNGQYSFGVDPFAYTTVGHYWANHAWLSDVGMYLAYRSLGGGALVVIKAALVALIAGVMFWMARGRGPVWLRTGCILLAILAMTPRLLLQPSVISLLLLALCLGCLQAGGRLLRAVPILIVLWVNLDSWFIMGPLLVGLFWIGRRIDADRIALGPWPVWLLPASLLACLISPHHVLGLTLPVELSPVVWTSGFATDPRYANVFLSPWHWPLYGAAGGYNLASWSFLILIGMGLLSFALNRTAMRSWRGLVWIAFVSLACWQVRLVPFFAVAAGPITAINLGELVPERTFRRPGRLMLVTVSLLSIALAWLGWTVGFRNRERGAGWAVHTDATLARAATGIADWREKNGVATDRHVFTTHVDLGHYLAWFAPGEKSALDSRFQLFGYEEYASLSRALGLLPDDEKPNEALSQVLSNKQIAAVALYDPDPRRWGMALSTMLYTQKASGRITRVDGSCVLIVPDDKTSAAIDPERMAFGRPNANDVSPAGNGPTALAEPIPPWVVKPLHGRGGSWEADTAAVYLWLFEERSRHDNDRFPPVPSYPLWFAGEMLRRSHSPVRSPALPLLAVRAARRGAEIDPRDASAWSVLGRAYLILSELTWEADAGEGLTLLRNLRLLQATTALVQAVLLSPDSAGVRQTLSRLYWAQGALDLAHRHAADALRITRQDGPPSGESRESFDQRLGRDAEFVDRLEATVMENENRFIIMTAGLTGDPLARAKIARQLGLQQKAIDTLMKSHPDLYGTEGIELLIELLIATGQTAEARVLLDRDEIRRAPDGLGIFSYPGKPHANGTPWSYQFPAYPWLNFCQYAASGQYERAASSLEVISELFARNEAALAPRYIALLSTQAAAEAAIAAPPGITFNRLIVAQFAEVQREHLHQARVLSVRRADLSALAGILELERGRPTEAEERLKFAKKLFDDVRPFAATLPGLPIVSRYLDAIEHKR